MRRRCPLKVITHDLGVNTEAVTIVPLGDVHIGAAFNYKHFQATIDYILNTPDTYCIIGGDIVDNATKNSIGGTYETIRPREQKKMAIKYLQPLAEAGKILSYIEGNHEHRSSKDTDTYIGEDICAALQIPQLYDPDGVFLFLNVGYNRKYDTRSRITYTALVLHGWSGARRIGGKANKLEDMQQIAAADIYILFHSHQAMTFTKALMAPDSRTKSLRQRKQVFVNANGYLNWEGYPVRKGYAPSEQTVPLLTLDGKKFDVACQV